MPVVGVMPVGRTLPEHASCFRWLVAAILLSMALLRLETEVEGGIFAASSTISSPGSQIGRRFFDSFSTLDVIAVMDKEQRRGRASVADWVGAHPRWILRRGYGAHCGERQPAGAVDLSDFLAEGRPLFFLPAMMPDGRQPVFCSSSTAWCCGDSAAPSGAVPGSGEVALVREQSGTQSHFSLAFRGPLCIRQGPVCNCSFVRGPVVRCSILQLHK